jgi:membrane-bound serine protease (ClpP class)
MESLLFWGLGLLGASLLLVAIEIFVPSAGVIALVATAVALAGIVCLFRYDPLWGIGGTLAMLVAGPGVAIYGLQLWRHTPIGRKMIGEPSEEQVEAARIEEKREADARLAMIGREGTAATDLRPVGIVLIEGKRYDALAEAGIIAAGARVRVTVVEGAQLKVRAVL